MGSSALFSGVAFCIVCERQEQRGSCSCLLAMINAFSCDQFGFKLPFKMLREESLTLSLTVQWMLLVYLAAACLCPDGR